MMKLYFGILAILGIFQTVASLKCYVCNSRFDVNCDKTPPSNVYSKECSVDTAQPIQRNTNHSETLQERSETRGNNTNYSFCRKSVTSIARQKNKNSVREAETVTIRSCGWIGEPAISCKWGSFDGTQVFMCTCLKDECNSSPGLPIFISTISGMILVTAMIFV